MRTVFLAGGIGSGKSTVATELERLGAVRIDLDQLSREVLAAGSLLLQQIAHAFGADLLDPVTGELNRGLLAQRAFATAQETARLEALELPAIRELLSQRLQEISARPQPPALCVVEVPLLDKVGTTISLADQVLVVTCPLDERRKRAIERGMTAEDFDARAARQPSEEWLRANATFIMENSGSQAQLVDCIHQWYQDQIGGGDR